MTGVVIAYAIGSAAKHRPTEFRTPLTAFNKEASVKFRTLITSALVAATVIAPAIGFAQTKLKWAHVYETSEPYHTESVWAAAEIKKRTNGKFDIQVFPASSLGKETDINQGMTLGTVDMIISGPSFAARSYPRLGIAYYPFIFRDAAHHFLRTFDRTFSVFERNASDADLADLADTRTARAFMLFGRAAGVFD